MQRFVPAMRLDGKKPAQIAERVGESVQAAYMRDYRARKRLSAEQRQRYVEALKRATRRRVKLQPLNLSFGPDR